MHPFTIKTIAACARSTRAKALFGLIIISLSACSALKPGPRPLVYDFGPGAVASSASASASGSATLPSMGLSIVEAPVALDGLAVMYRLAYSDAQQLRPYAHARWSMAPAQLLHQRLNEQLGQRRAVISTGLGMVLPAPLMTLHVELEEFSQLFDSANSSSALLRIRATLGQAGARIGTQELVAQRSFVVQRPARTPDAVGGVQALADAADAAIVEIDTWVAQVQATRPAAKSPSPASGPISPVKP
jgi:cholesterol transport system auxiliary component